MTSYRIAGDEPVEAAVRRIGCEQVEDALDWIDAAADDVETAVHEVRKTCKKVRGLARLVRPGLGDAYREENAWFRDTARRLSGVRDLHVMGRTFDGVCERFSGEHDCARFAPIRERLVERHAGSCPDAEQARAMLSETRPALAGARERIARWRIPDDGFAALEPGLRLTYRRGRRAMAAVAGRPTVERVHEWRKRAKYHWYHLRLLGGCWRPVMDAWRNEADALSEALGDAHDCAVLRRALATDVELVQSSHGLADLLRLIDCRYDELIATALEYGERLYAERPRRLTERLGCYWRAWRPDDPLAPAVGVQPGRRLAPAPALE